MRHYEALAWLLRANGEETKDREEKSQRGYCYQLTKRSRSFCSPYLLPLTGHALPREKKLITVGWNSRLFIGYLLRRAPRKS